MDVVYVYIKKCLDALHENVAIWGRKRGSMNFVKKIVALCLGLLLLSVAIMNLFPYVNLELIPDGDTKEELLSQLNEKDVSNTKINNDFENDIAKKNDGNINNSDEEDITEKNATESNVVKTDPDSTDSPYGSNFNESSSEEDMTKENTKLDNNTSGNGEEGYSIKESDNTYDDSVQFNKTTEKEIVYDTENDKNMKFTEELEETIIEKEQYNDNENEETIIDDESGENQVDKDAELKKEKLETDTPLIYVEDVKAKPGEEKVKVCVNVKNNPGILGMTLSVYYDENAVSLKQVANGVALSDVLTLTEANKLKSGCNFVWDGQAIEQQDIMDGSIIELEFDVGKQTSAGKYQITVIYDNGDVIDRDLKPIEIAVVNGSIEVK